MSVMKFICCILFIKIALPVSLNSIIRFAYVSDCCKRAAFSSASFIAINLSSLICLYSHALYKQAAFNSASFISIILASLLCLSSPALCVWDGILDRKIPSQSCDGQHFLTNVAISHFKPCYFIPKLLLL